MITDGKKYETPCFSFAATRSLAQGHGFYLFQGGNFYPLEKPFFKVATFTHLKNLFLRWQLLPPFSDALTFCIQLLNFTHLFKSTILTLLKPLPNFY